MYACLMIQVSSRRGNCPVPQQPRTLQKNWKSCEWREHQINLQLPYECNSAAKVASIMVSTAVAVRTTTLRNEASVWSPNICRDLRLSRSNTDLLRPRNIYTFSGCNVCAAYWHTSSRTREQFVNICIVSQMYRVQAKGFDEPWPLIIVSHRVVKPSSKAMPMHTPNNNTKCWSVETSKESKLRFLLSLEV